MFPPYRFLRSMIRSWFNPRKHLPIQKKNQRSGLSLGVEELANRIMPSTLGTNALLEGPAAGTTPNAALQTQLNNAYGQLPLAFEANQGQTDAQVQYLTRGSGYSLFLTAGGTVLSLQPTPAGNSDPSSRPADISGVALAQNLVGANPQAPVVGLDQLPGTSNYFAGNDPSQWHTNITSYGKVEYQGVYPGVNLVYYGNQQQLEYDFVVAPGADPGSIRFSVQGADSLSLDEQGNLVLHTASGDVLEHAPMVYQNTAGGQQTVAGQFVLLGQNQIGFQVGPYDASLPLTIDPILSYSTYLGGNGADLDWGIAVDSSGDAYIAGQTSSTNFPTTTGAYHTTYNGGADDLFVSKFNATGTGLLYSTYLGGAGDEQLNGTAGSIIAIDSSGNAYVTGYTSSTNFPVTSGALRTSNAGIWDAFVTKINPTGTGLVYSTYLGGNNDDVGQGIAVDSSGDAYITGYTDSTSGFPISAGAFQSTHSDINIYTGFVAKLNPSGTSLLYGTYLGGTTEDIPLAVAVNSTGDAFVTGKTYSTNYPTTSGAFQTSHGSDSAGADVFVTELNTTGTGLVHSTFLGGNGYDFGRDLVLDSSGDVFVTGYTKSTNFPTSSGAFQTTFGGGSTYGDAFVTKLNPTLSGVVYSTYLGGSQPDGGNSIAIDSLGNAYIAGFTFGPFPTTPDALQTTFGGGGDDAFLAKLNSTGTTLLYSTYLGGTGQEEGQGVALDSAGNIYISGQTSSTNFPTTSGAYQTSFHGGTDNVFVAKFSLVVSTSTTVGTSQASVAYGNTVTFTATVVATSGSTAPAQGNVDFKDTTTGMDFGNGTFVSSNNGTLTSIWNITVAVNHNPNLFKVTPGDTILASYAPGTNFTGSSGTLSGGQAVTARPITVTAQTNTKTYDGGTSAGAIPTISGGIVSGDAVTTLIETYDTRNVGTGKTLTPIISINDGNGGANYAVTPVVNPTGEIDKATLTLTAKTNTKIYDAHTSAAATPTVAGLQGTDTVTGLAETYDTKNVGTGKTLAVSAFTVNDGNSGGNYTVSTVIKTTGEIDKAPLTITAKTNTKTYDATTSAAATPTVAGLQGTDTVTGLAETYDTKNVGTGKTLTVSTFTVSDGNYTVSTVINTTGEINKATLTITAQTNTKTYDATTSAAATPTVAGLQDTDTVTGLAETYNTNNVGTGKTLTVSAFTVSDGNSGGNYTVSTVTNTTGEIDKATLTITAQANTKTYDATPRATTSPTVAGLQGSDTVAGLVETYDTPNVGPGKTLTVTAYTVDDGNSGGNYAVILQTNTTGVINTSATHFVVTPLSTSTTAGQAILYTVQAADSSNNPVNNFNGTVTMTSSDPNAATQGTIPVNNGFGFGQAALTTATASGWTLTASAGILPGTSAAVVVTPGAATHFSVNTPSVPPSTSLLGGTLGASEAGVTVTLHTSVLSGLTAGQVVLVAGVSVPGYNGMFTLLSAAGTTLTYTANQTGLTASGGGTVGLFATTGSPLSTTVTALDAYGNTATSYTGTVKLTSSDSAASFPINNYTFTTGAGNDNGVHAFSATQNTAGSQTITATDTTSTNPILGGTSGAIATRGLAVTSYTPTTTGFVLTFDKPLNPSALSLYGVGQAAFNPPGLTLTGPGGAVKGTVLLNANDTTLTFVQSDQLLVSGAATAGELADGNYTLTLSSGLNGFQDTAGKALDGNGNGNGNTATYVTHFTTTYQAATVGVTVTDFAVGPGQSVNLSLVSPNASAPGLPINLSDGDNATQVVFNLTYNTHLLDITGATADSGDTGTPVTSTVTRTMTGTPDANGIETDQFTFSTNSATTLGTGSLVTLGELTANVPSSARNLYQATALLDISAATDNGTHGTLAGVDGVQLNAYLGDTSGNGSYDPSDAALAARVAAGGDTGFAAYRLVDPAIVGGVSGAGYVAAPDASQIAAFTVGNFANAPSIEPLPSPALTITATGPDPALSISGGPIVAGEEVQVSVNIDDPHPADSTGLTEATLALTYDPQVLSVSPKDIQLGTVPLAATGWTLTAVVNQATGQVGITLYSLTPIGSSIGGSLVTIEFHVQAGARGVSPVQLVATVNPTGQSEVRTGLDDSLGALTLHVAPPAGFLPAMDGRMIVLPLAPPPPQGTAAPTVLEPLLWDAVDLNADWLSGLGKDLLPGKDQSAETVGLQTAVSAARDEFFALAEEVFV